MMITIHANYCFFYLNYFQHLIWRRDHKIDEILKENFSYWQKDFPFYTDGIDFKGRPGMCVALHNIVFGPTKPSLYPLGEKSNDQGWLKLYVKFPKKFRKVKIADKY